MSLFFIGLEKLPFYNLVVTYLKAQNKNYNKLYKSADLPVPFKWNNDGVTTDVEIIQLTKNNQYYNGDDKPYLIYVRENGKTSMQYLTAAEFKNMQPDLK